MSILKGKFKFKRGGRNRLFKCGMHSAVQWLRFVAGFCEHDYKLSCLIKSSIIFNCRLV